MAAPECEREVRKRRERRDSGCSHERKERRPHSEERPLPPPPPPPPLHDCNRLESERRAERLSRARRPQYGGKRRRAPSRIQKQPKENDCFSTEDSPYINPKQFDYVVIQKSLSGEDPETLDEGGLDLQEELDDSSREAAAEKARQDERNVAPKLTARRDQPTPSKHLEKINKKIGVLKRSISKYEADFELQNGYSITPSDRITEVPLMRMYENLQKLQVEKKCIKSDPVEYALKVQAAKLQKERDDKLENAFKSDKSMPDIVKDMEEWLEGCRQAAGRSAIPESSWTPAQLAAEKLCVQRVLLRLEAARGRPPAHSADRGAARHLYERYRAVKRALPANRSDAVIGANGELATIHEHETMLFHSSVDSSSDSQEKPSDSSQDTTETPLQSPPAREIVEEVASSTSSAKSEPASDEVPTNEGLHCLGLEDLTRALTEAKLQKCVLRRSIKEYEITFEIQNSRKVQKDDKMGREEEYLRYKAVKARIKLLNALINKQKALLK